MSKNITIPTLTVARIASQITGHPVLTQDELLQLIAEFPTMSIEIPDSANLNQQNILEKVVKSVQIDALDNNKYTGSLYDAINNENIFDDIDKNNKTKDIEKAMLNYYADIDEMDSKKLVYIALAEKFSLLEDKDEHFCDIDSYLTETDLHNIIAKTKGLDELPFKDANEKSVIRSKAFKILIKEFLNVDIESDTDIVNTFVKNNIEINTSVDMDDEITKYEVIETIINMLRHK